MNFKKGAFAKCFVNLQYRRNMEIVNVTAGVNVWQHRLYYVKNQQDATLAVLFISNCKITVHVSDVHHVHHQQYINCCSSRWYMSWVGVVYIQYRLPSSVVYFTKS